MKINCKYGHPLSGENLYVFPDGRRACKICRNRVAMAWDKNHPERSREIKARFRNSVKGKRAQVEGHRRYTYKMTQEQYEERLDRQDHRCSACRRIFTEKNYPCVDHDHGCCPEKKSCGACLRDILCFHCNTALGHLDDDPLILNALVEYLTRWRKL